jgi:DNA invertase Pin-like site-specific DNA recombinase
MRAVLYCRVSTVEQTQNLSLPTQEQACREYCSRHGYDVDAVFVDSESAKTADRTEFQRMLEHCRRNKGRLQAVVVYSLTRFSRNSAAHHAIASLLRGLGIALRSVTEPIDDTPSGKLMEGILASMAQFDNDVRSERVTAGMQAAIDRGRWVWHAPLGYLNGRRGGPSLLPDPDRAPAVRELFELCAAGVVGSALHQRANDLGLRTKHGHTVSQPRLYKLLRQPVYMGVVRQATWGKDRRGDFEPLVSEHTFARVAAQLSAPIMPGPGVGTDRPHEHAFPLRRFARCQVCGRALTGSWSRGKMGTRYAFYHCTRGCVRVSKAALEQAFVELLEQLRPHPAYWALLRADVLDAWRLETEQAREANQVARRRVAEIELKRSQLDDAFIYRRAIDDHTYRAQRDALREALTVATLEASEAASDALDVDGMLTFAEHVLEHAGALWTMETSPARRVALQWLLFPTGFSVPQTGKIELPVTCLECFQLPQATQRDSWVGEGLVDHPSP